MVRLRQRQRFRTGTRPEEEVVAGEAENAPDDRKEVRFRRTATLRGSDLTTRSPLWLVALLVIIVTAIMLLG